MTRKEDWLTTTRRELRCVSATRPERLQSQLQGIRTYEANQLDRLRGLLELDDEVEAGGVFGGRQLLSLCARNIIGVAVANQSLNRAMIARQLSVSRSTVSRCLNRLLAEHAILGVRARALLDGGLPLHRKVAALSPKRRRTSAGRISTAAEFVAASESVLPDTPETRQLGRLLRAEEGVAAFRFIQGRFKPVVEGAIRFAAGWGIGRYCFVCQREIQQPARGRRRVTCSDRCRQRLSRLRRSKASTSSNTG